MICTSMETLMNEQKECALLQCIDYFIIPFLKSGTLHKDGYISFPEMSKEFYDSIMKYLKECR